MDRIESLADLRSRLTQNQREILGAIWRRYRQRGEWIPTRVLYHEFGKEAVHAASEHLSGSIVYVSPDPQQVRFQLTFLGVLLTDEGEQFEDLILKYLDYARNQYLSDPEADVIASAAICDSLGLSGHECRTLGILLNMSHLWGRSAQFGEESWSVGVPENVEDYPAIDSLKTYLHAHVMKDFDPAMPSDYPQRLQYVSGKLTEVQRPIELPSVPVADQQSNLSFVEDARLRKILEEDWEQANHAWEAGWWKVCAVLCGGILEGLLLYALNREEIIATAEFQRLNQRRKEDITAWNLIDLVDLASELRILNPGTIHAIRALKEFRNLIHPGRLMREGTEVGNEEANIALSAVSICISELMRGKKG